MAWIETNAKTGRLKLCFRWSGRKFKHTLRGVTVKEAEATRHRAEETLGLIERGRLIVPMDADFLTYVISEGRIATRVRDVAKPEPLTLKGLFDRYIEIVSNGSLESNTVDTMKIRFKHILETLGSRKVLHEVTLDDVQKHIDRRARKKIGSRFISAGTLRARITSFRVCWNWALKAKKVRPC